MFGVVQTDFDSDQTKGAEKSAPFFRLRPKLSEAEIPHEGSGQKAASARTIMAKAIAARKLSSAKYQSPRRIRSNTAMPVGTDRPNNNRARSPRSEIDNRKSPMRTFTIHYR
jgi:hypothetical protein